jgi:hypothetical protein
MQAGEIDVFAVKDNFSNDEAQTESDTFNIGATQEGRRCRTAALETIIKYGESSPSH